jgi:hypothetical protein
VIAYGAVDESGGSAQLFGDPLHCRDVDFGTGKSGSTIESHA